MKLRRPSSSPAPAAWIACLVATVLVSGCSVRKLAVNKVADALTGGGSTFTSDDDPELVRDALPFSLKLMESLLAETPKHPGLLLTLGSGFTQYGFAFVQQDAERIEDDDLERARELQVRARRLYLRGRNYALRGLEAAHPGFTNALHLNPRAAVQAAEKADVPFLYWSAVGWAGAIAQAKDDPSLVADLPQVEALIERALELNESWNRGTLHGLMITFAMSRTTGTGDPVERATHHFERALQLGGKANAGPYVAYAESVCVAQEDRVQFETLLRQALAIDADIEPESRLENLIHQRRAQWLLNRIDKLFLPSLP
jgi:predicted anti-sigma-YlaC factor YlaD